MSNEQRAHEVAIEFAKAWANSRIALGQSLVLDDSDETQKQAYSFGNVYNAMYDDLCPKT